MDKRQGIREKREGTRDKEARKELVIGAEHLTDKFIRC